MDAQKQLGWETESGGGGGNFLRTAMFRWKADLLHFHWLHPYIVRDSRPGTCFRGLRFFFELLLLRISGQRLIWTMHNIHGHDAKFPQLELFFRRIAVSLFHKVLCHSEAAKAAAIDLFGKRAERFVVVPHPNFIDFYPGDIESRKARSKLGVGDNDFVFVFFGRVAKYKGIEDLISAFRKIEGKQYQLVIAGSPSSESYANELTELANDERIVLKLDRIGDDEIQFFMKAADVVALPFRKILTSGSVILAMGFGKPVIAPQDGGMTEILAESPLLFSSGGLDRAMVWATENRESLARDGMRNFEQVANWTWGQLAKECLA